MRYTVSANVTISVFTEVDADSAEEAEEKVSDRGMIGLCHQCGGSRDAEEVWCTSGELDGEPRHLTATEG